MIYGSCEDGARINVSSGKTSFTVYPDGVYFAAAVPLYSNGKNSVTVSAISDGKLESEKKTYTVINDKNADDTNLTVTLGSRVVEKRVLPDVYGTNALFDAEINDIVNCAKARVAAAKKNAGKDVRIVYVIVPDPLTVYSEELTDEMKSRVVSPSKRLKQAAAALERVDGVTVIDLTQTMISNKENGKLYYKLDSHWTELGALYGYTEIMERLGLPHYSLSDYTVEYKTIDDTDMNVYSGDGTGQMYENAPFLSAKFEEKTPYGKNKEDTARIWSFANQFFVGQYSETVIKDSDKPTALFLSDSYGLNIIPYLAESFGRFVTVPMWRYKVDYSRVKSIKPDYIIELLAERDVDELLSST